MQLPICSKLQCNNICDKFVCDGSRPHYIGDNGIDIASHVCWLISCLFWHRVLFNFITVQLFELKRRAKLTEVRLQAADSRVCCCHLFYQEWADTLRHGRDRFVSFILFFGVHSSPSFCCCVQLLPPFDSFAARCAQACVSRPRMRC